MREPIAAFTSGIKRLLATDEGWRALSAQWRVPAAPRLIRIETQPWRSATFDGWAFEFILEALVPSSQPAAASLVCAGLSDALHDVDLPLPGHVLIEMNAIHAVVEAGANGAATCRVTFSALTVVD